MKMRTATARWALVIALGSTLLATAAAPASAAGPASAQGWMQRLQTKLQLTDDQTKAIQDIYTRDAATQQQIFQSLRQAQTDLRRLALNNGDPAAIQQKAAEIQGLMAQGLQLRVQHLQEIAPLLSQEQRDGFAQLSAGPWMRRPHGHAAPGTSS